MNFSIVCVAESRQSEARACAEECHLPLADMANAVDDYAVIFSESDVRLRSNSQRHGDVLVDFIGGNAAHRRKFGGGKGQTIAKAVGIKGALRPRVMDLTAGLGQDAFVLATLGCEVTLVERHPVVRALLRDGLQRARHFAADQDAELSDVLARMQLLEGDAKVVLATAQQKPQVIYLDPMFPQRQKSAQVKKEMQAFHELVGADDDADELLRAALAAAENRVVVKRPRVAPALGQWEPSYRLEGRSSRFDVYALKKFTS